jgi:replicative DNA helicase
MTQDPFVPDGTPPQNVELEMAVLGAVMLEPRWAYPVAAGIIQHHDFYLDGHALMFRIFGELYVRGIMPDAASVIDELRSRNQLDEAGGSGVVLGMLNSVPTAANIEYHCMKVLDKSIRRLVMLHCQHGIRGAIDAQTSIQATVTGLQNMLTRAVERDRRGESINPLQHHAAEEYARLSELYDAGGIDTASGVTTGFEWLNETMGGFQAGDLVIWAARPNCGKTRILLYSLASAGMSGTPVGFISLDMSQRRLLSYLIPTAANLAGVQITGQDIYRPALWGAPEKVLLRRACEAADPAGNFWLVLNPKSNSLYAIESYIREMAVSNGSKVIAIDQAQNIAGWAEGGKDRSQYAIIVNGLHQMARAYGCAIVLVHQIQRAGADAPTLANLKDTGCVEEFSDSVVILHDRQRALIDAYGGFVRDGLNLRKPKDSDNNQSIVRNVDLVRSVRIGLEKNRNRETRREYCMFDFARGIQP